MFKEYTDFKKICIACGYTALRYGVDGFAAIIKHQFHLDPFDKGTLFLFCGRKNDRIKGLLWEGDGFLLLYKRLSDGKYQWPRSAEDMKQMSQEQFCRLMSGFSIDSSIKESSPRCIV